MKVVATADLHGARPLAPECDLLVLAGDCLPHNFEQLLSFKVWLRKQPAKHIVGIAGNHDFVAQNFGPAMRLLPWTYLQDETVEIEGVKIHGSPWTPTFFNWAFMAEDDQLADKWALIPKDVDLLVTHGPPWGILDLAQGKNRAGSATLRTAVQWHLDGPLTHVFGHIHEGRGEHTEDGKRFMNVSWVDAGFNPYSGGWVEFEL